MKMNLLPMDNLGVAADVAAIVAAATGVFTVFAIIIQSVKRRLDRRVKLRAGSRLVEENGAAVALFRMINRSVKPETVVRTGLSIWLWSENPTPNLDIGSYARSRRTISDFTNPEGCSFYISDFAFESEKSLPTRLDANEVYDFQVNLSKMMRKYDEWGRETFGSKWFFWLEMRSLSLHVVTTEKAKIKLPVHPEIKSYLWRKYKDENFICRT